MTEKRAQHVAANAIELLKELRDPDIIPPYNAVLVETCAKQIEELYNENINTLMEFKSGRNQREDQVLHMIRVRQTGIDKIKRCCCAYLSERIKRVKHLRWKLGGHLPASVRANLSEQELEWLRTYNDTIFTFQNQFSKEEGDDGVNLLNYVDPPEKLMVKVRALENSGQFETSDGTCVILNKGTFHLLPKHDCENLVRRGVLEYVKQ